MILLLCTESCHAETLCFYVIFLLMCNLLRCRDLFMPLPPKECHRHYVLGCPSVRPAISTPLSVAPSVALSLQIVCKFIHLKQKFKVSAFLTLYNSTKK